MSPLAIEILSDLKNKFPDGATIPDLAEWLGDPAPLIVKALKELMNRSLIHRDGVCYHYGHIPAGDRQRTW